MLADVCDLNNCGGAVHRHLLAAAGDGFPCSPTISEKISPSRCENFSCYVTAGELVITAGELVITAGELVITASELVITAAELEVCFTLRGAPV